VVNLIAKNPLADLLPFSEGNVTLIDATPLSITSIIPQSGKANAVSKVMETAHGVKLPAPGRTTGQASNRVIWSGRGQYFLIGDEPANPSISKLAALADQSDGWVIVHLEGDDSAAVLARLCPIDIRPDQFRPGHTARTEVAHLSSVVTRLANGFEIMVMRSFTKTALHHLTIAMKSVAARTGSI